MSLEHCVQFPVDIKNVDNITITQFLTSFFCATSIWLSASDEYVHAAYRWIDGYITKWTNWENQKPHQPAGKNCIARRGSNKKWFPEDCSVQLHYYCESIEGMINHSNIRNILSCPGQQDIESPPYIMDRRFSPVKCFKSTRILQPTLELTQWQIQEFP